MIPLILAATLAVAASKATPSRTPFPSDDAAVAYKHGFEDAALMWAAISKHLKDRNAYIVTRTATPAPTPNVEAICVAKGHEWCGHMFAPGLRGCDESYFVSTRKSDEEICKRRFERCRRCGLWREVK